VGDKTYFDLGKIRGARIVLVQSETGSGGPYGSTLTVMDGINAFNPTAIILVGIAFGVDPPRQRLGDILISRQLLDYDVVRVGTGRGRRPAIVPRGDRPSGSLRLLDRFHAGLLDWKGAKVRFGLILSGAKLVDNVDFRDDIVRLAGGEAVGGEMEGGGLYASAHRRKIDWIVVKAVSDWADGRKRQGKATRQRQAALNAAEYVLHVLNRGGFDRE